MTTTSLSLGRKPESHVVTLASGRARPSVMLVSMPMASMARPSIQIGLLATAAQNAGYRAETYHASLDFGADVLNALGSVHEHSPTLLLEQSDHYSQLADDRGMLGDWLFAREAFGDDTPRTPEISVATAADRVGLDLEQLELIRREVVPSFLDDALATLDLDEFDVIGFSSTFQQTVASLALARRIKAKSPDTITLFGGANFDGPMGRELIRSMGDIDLVLQGEADSSFIELLHRLRDRADVLDVPGVLVRLGETVLSGPASRPVENLSAPGAPAYDEYFERAEARRLLPSGAHRFVKVPFESARGCWWGEKAHCTFCGLNGDTMAFRPKPSADVLNEIAELTRRYGTLRLFAVDNILDTDHLKPMFDTFIKQGLTLDLFYEVKADLGPADLQRLRRAGITTIQPGIESLSSHVLGLMRKGTRASWNVNLLRWARVFGIEVAWNVLWGFEGETDADYTEQIELSSKLHHLQPPDGMGRVWLERFSPMFQDPAAFGMTNVRPAAGYQQIFPERVDLDEVAYFFDYEAESNVTEETITGLSNGLEAWVKSWAGEHLPSLVRHRGPNFIRIVDDRGDQTMIREFDGPVAAIHEACMYQPRTAKQVAEALGGVDQQSVVTVLDELTDLGLMMRDRALYLALAVPPLEHALNEAAELIT